MKRLTCLGKLFGASLLAATLSACVHKDIRLPDFALDEIMSGSIGWQTSVNQKRTSGTVELSNRTDVPIFCSEIGYRVIYDFPVSYLEAGEKTYTFFNKYIDANEVVSFDPISVSKTDVQIRSLQGGTFESCRVEYFDDACRNKDKNTAERMAFKKMLSITDTKSCNELSNYLLTNRYLDLRTTENIYYGAFERLSYEIILVLSESQYETLGSRLASENNGVIKITYLKDRCNNKTIKRAIRSTKCIVDNSESMKLQAQKL